MSSGRRVTFFLSRIGAVVAAVIVLIALLLSGLRLAINYAPELRAHTESFLSELLDVSLTLGGLHAEWTGRHPRIILEDVVLFDDDGAQALQLDELELRVALISSIRNRSPQLAEVSVSGLKLTVEREVDGGFRLRGFCDIEVGESGDEEALTPAPFSVRLKDVELVYIDRISGDQIEFGPSQLRLDSRGGRVRVAGALTLPDEIGGAVRFLAAWQGAYDSGEGELYAGLDAVRLGELRRWLPVDVADWPAIDGLFSGELWLGAEQGRIVYADGNVALTGLVDEQGVLAQRLGGRFNWRTTDAGWRLKVDRSM